MLHPYSPEEHWLVFSLAQAVTLKEINKIILHSTKKKDIDIQSRNVTSSLILD